MSENLDNDIKEVENQLKELISKKRELIMQNAEDQILNKYLKADEIILKIKHVSHVIDSSTVHVKVYAVSVNEDELMICDNYPIDLNFEKNKFEPSNEEEFSNALDNALSKINSLER